MRENKVKRGRYATQHRGFNPDSHWIPLQDHASSHKHEASHETSGVLGHITKRRGSVGGGGTGGRYGGGGGGGRVSRGRDGQGGRSAGRRRRRSGAASAGVLATTVHGLLASALALGVIGVRSDALAVGILADVEGNSLDVLRHIGGGVVAADTAELQSSLVRWLVVCASARQRTILTGSHELSLVPLHRSGQVLR